MNSDHFFRRGYLLVMTTFNTRHYSKDFHYRYASDGHRYEKL
jgi:hypothetical protein